MKQDTLPHRLGRMRVIGWLWVCVMAAGWLLLIFGPLVLAAPQ